jgi:TPR repeat protein
MALSLTFAVPAGAEETRAAPPAPTKLVEPAPLPIESQEVIALKPLVGTGDISAEYALGAAYARMRKPAAYSHAEKWWLKAAEGGNTDAQVALGGLYTHTGEFTFVFADGVGVGLNYDAAFKWYRKAADKGSSKAAYGLAEMFDAGWGMHPDSATGAIWRHRGDDMAQAEAKASASNMGALAAKGDANSQYAMGQLYYTGEGVPKSTQDALKWFRLAAAQGHADAERMLGLIYCDTAEPTQDYPQALEWFKKSAAQGQTEAEYWVGLLYENGKGGIAQNYKEAAKWYRQAADHGNVSAQFSLGYLYYLGQSGYGLEDNVQQSYEDAYFWMSLARLNKDMFETLSEIKKEALKDCAKHLTQAQKDAIKERLLAWTPTLPAQKK